jgi:hypothetical protein
MEELNDAWSKILDGNTQRANKKYSPAESIFILQTKTKNISQNKVAEFLSRPDSGVSDKVRAILKDWNLFTSTQISYSITQEEKKLDQNGRCELQKLRKAAVSPNIALHVVKKTTEPSTAKRLGCLRGVECALTIVFLEVPVERGWIWGIWKYGNKVLWNCHRGSRRQHIVFQCRVFFFL